LLCERNCKLLENSSYNWGFNTATGEYQDLVKAGVIDPAKVVRTALQDAASVASERHPAPPERVTVKVKQDRAVLQFLASHPEADARSETSIFRTRVAMLAITGAGPSRS
jgi:hypothetical protein